MSRSNGLFNIFGEEIHLWGQRFITRYEDEVDIAATVNSDLHHPDLPVKYLSVREPHTLLSSVAINAMPNVVIHDMNKYLEAMTVVCQAGFYRTQAGCTRCPPDTYSDCAGYMNCIGCPIGKFHSKTGSTSESDCEYNPAAPSDGENISDISVGQTSSVNNQKKCRRFIESQVEKGDLTGDSLFSDLPGCPPSINQIVMTTRSGLLIFPAWMIDESCTPDIALSCESSRPGAKQCFISNSNQYGACQQCCYHASGALVTSGSGQGLLQQYCLSRKVSQKIDRLKNEFLPQSQCCSPTGWKDGCSIITNQRTHKLRKYVPARDGWMFGDPHLVTVFGFSYSFNGYGDFQGLSCKTLQMHLRLEPPENTHKATVIKGVALEQKQNILEILQNQNTDFPFEISANKQTFRPMAGVSRYFLAPWTILFERGTKGISVQVHVDVNISMRIYSAQGALTLEIVYIAGDDSDIKGLLGSLEARNGTAISLNASERVLFYDFGMTWLLSPSESLFSRPITQPIGTLNSVFVPIFLDELIITPDIRSICGEIMECSADLAITSDLGIALVSSSMVQDYQTSLLSKNLSPEFIPSSSNYEENLIIDYLNQPRPVQFLFAATDPEGSAVMMSYISSYVLKNVIWECDYSWNVSNCTFFWIPLQDAIISLPSFFLLQIVAWDNSSLASQINIEFHFLRDCGPGFFETLPGFDSISNPSFCAPCPAGTYRSLDSPNCLLCPENTFSPDSNVTAISFCIQCPEGMRSPQGSTKRSDCELEANSNLNISSQCGDGIQAVEEECDDGNINEGDGCSSLCFCERLPCNMCPVNSVRQALTINTTSLKSDCICVEGFYVLDDLCIECSENHWCSNGVKIPCPPNSFSEPLSDNSENCSCISGFLKSLDGLCFPVLQTYNDTGGKCSYQS
jgi:cysteine-rich repeat protein